MNAMLRVVYSVWLIVLTMGQSRTPPAHAGVPATGVLRRLVAAAGAGRS